MKKILTVLAALSLMFVQSLTPVFADNATEVSVKTGVEFLNALEDSNASKITLETSFAIDIDFEDNAQQFVRVNHVVEIDGKGHTISFNGKMSKSVTSVFQFRNDVTLKNITFEAPDKVNADDLELNAYTSTILSFYGSDMKVNVDNVTVRRAKVTHNPQVAINIVTSGNSTVEFNKLFVDGGRIFFEANASGNIVFNNSTISQEGVPFLDGTNDADGILWFKGNTKDSISLEATNSVLFVNKSMIEAGNFSENFIESIENLANKSGFTLFDVTDAVPTARDAINVKTADGFMKALNNPGIAEITLVNDITDINYETYMDQKGTLITVNHPVTINGKGHTIAFDNSVKMPAKSVSVFNFRNDVKISNVNIFAPDKQDVSNEKFLYTPTLLSFAGTDVTVDLDTVTLNVAEESLNPQIAVYVNTRGISNLTFEKVMIPSGRLNISSSARGGLFLNNSVVSQENVTIFDEDLSDSIINNFPEKNFSIISNNSKFIINGSHPVVQRDFMNNLRYLPLTIGDIKIIVTLPNDGQFKQDSINVNLGDDISVDELSSLFGLVDGQTTLWSNIVLSNTNVNNGKVNTSTEGVITVSADYGFEVDGEFYGVNTYEFTINVIDNSEPEVPVVNPEIVGDSNISEEIDVVKIEVSFNDNQFNGVVSSIEFGLPPITNQQQQSINDQIASLLAGKFEALDILVLSISPLDANNNKLQVVNGYVEISVPVPTSLDSSKPFAIFHVNQDGTLDLLSHTVENGVITFKATAFSNFVIANIEALVDEELPTTPVEPETPITPVEPETPTQPEVVKPEEENTLPGAGTINLSMYGLSLIGMGAFTMALGNKKTRKK